MLVFWWLGAAAMLHAQQPNVHYWHQGVMPPGAIGSRQLQRGGPLPGYFQPVEIKVPTGALISLAAESQFDHPQPGSRKAGMLIGAVYRMRVTNIRMAEGAEVFPTVEVIDRIYPPLGQERRFPIPIDITEDDLKLAIDGKFVTRVIYLEDPRNALPAREVDKSQRWFEAQPGQDPLAVADGLGRPVAILRLGGRLPDQGADPFFFFGSPPLVAFPPEQAAAPKKTGAGAAGNVRMAANDGVTVKLPPQITATVKLPAQQTTTNSDAGVTVVWPSQRIVTRPQREVAADDIGVASAAGPAMEPPIQRRSDAGVAVRLPPEREQPDRKKPTAPKVKILSPPPGSAVTSQPGSPQSQAAVPQSDSPEDLPPT
jgi:hypothetical protein